MIVKKRIEIICIILTLLFVLASNVWAEGGWATNGERIYNTNSGNVGIGTTSPSQKLDVNGRIAIEGQDFITYDSSGNAFSIGDLRSGDGTVGKFHFRTNDQTRMTIDANGNVGLGTVNPAASLDISGAGRRVLTVHADNDNQCVDDGSCNPVLRFMTEANDTLDALIYLENLGGDSKLHFDVEDRDALVIHDGNVGIGTTSPTATLHINKSNPAIRLEEGNVRTWDIALDNAPDSLQFRDQTSKTVPLTISSTGNVGIGTTSPSQKLDVNGRIAIEGQDFITYDSSGNAFSIGDLRSGDGTVGKFHFRTNDQTRMTIDANGNVGLGTVNPAASLDISGAGRRVLTVHADNDNQCVDDGSCNPVLRFMTEANDTLDALIYLENLGGDSKLHFDVEDRDALVIHDGNVGIGTTSPTATLHINKSNPAIRLEEGNVRTWDIALDNAPDSLQFRDQTSKTVPLTISSTGNVGIGTTSPSQKLDVNGRIAIKGQDFITYDSSGNAFSIGDLRSGDGTVGKFHFRTNDQTRMTIDANGNVGIGTTNPKESIDVSGKVSSDSGLVYNSGNGNEWWITGTANGPAIMLQQHSGKGASSDRRGSLGWMDNLGEKSEFLTWYNSNIGIGTTNPQSKLAVNGTITANEIKVETSWSDFVFDEDYNLASLDQVESFIRENKHLPDIPSAKEVTQQGLAVSEMLAKQMQKIEELTLYLIQLKKENENLKATMAEQNMLLSGLKDLRERIEALEVKN